MVTKYVKGNVDRGYTVGGVEEVVLILDDNCMQLQGMAGSRFIGPFLNTVQRWEQVLSLISEVIAVTLYCRTHLLAGLGFCLFYTLKSKKVK